MFVIAVTMLVNAVLSACEGHKNAPVVYEGTRPGRERSGRGRERLFRGQTMRVLLEAMKMVVEAV
jgi:hypothetical protein